MGLSLNIPQDAENTLRQAFGADLDRAALEALVIEGYRSKRLGVSEVRRALGLETRFEAEQWLGKHGVPWHYSGEDFQSDLETLRRALGPERKGHLP